MRIFGKVTVLVGSILILIGIIVFIVAIIFGGRFNYTFSGENTNISESYDDIKELVIDYRAGELNIVEGDEFKIVAENVSKKYFVSKVENSIWTVSDKYDKTFWFFSGIDFHNKDRNVTIYIPKDYQLDLCKFTLGAGKLVAEDIKTQKIEVKVGAGEVKINSLTSKDADFDCGVGEITVSGEITGDSNIKCGVGKIGLDLKGDPQSYNYSVKVGIGHTQINGDSYSGVSNKTINNNDATSKFTLDCGVGEIDVQIKPKG